MTNQPSPSTRRPYLLIRRGASGVPHDSLTNSPKSPPQGERGRPARTRPPPFVVLLAERDALDGAEAGEGGGDAPVGQVERAVGAGREAPREREPADDGDLGARARGDPYE